MSTIEKIIDQLILQIRNFPNNGFYHGRMGMVVALYSYAVKSHDENLKNFSWDILEYILENIYENLPIGLENGLAGIGYGITFLKKEVQLDCELNDVLSDIDHKIMEHDPRRILDSSLRTGALGILSYLQLRKVTEPSLLSFDSQFLKELDVRLQHLQINKTDINAYSPFRDFDPPLWAKEDFWDKDLGINAGLTYYVLQELKYV